jgi:hypothetical protein
MVFVDEIYYYMDCQQREQGRKLTGVIPTPEQYWETRLGTSAVTSMLALNECVDPLPTRPESEVLTQNY